MVKKFNPFEMMSREQRLAFFQYQTEQIERLKAQNVALEARIEKPEHRLNKISSSKPAGSAGLKKPGRKAVVKKGNASQAVKRDMRPQYANKGVLILQAASLAFAGTPFIPAIPE